MRAWYAPDACGSSVGELKPASRATKCLTHWSQTVLP